MFGWATAAAHAESGKGKDGSGDRDGGRGRDRNDSSGDGQDDRKDDDSDDHDEDQGNGSHDTNQPDQSALPSRTPSGVRQEGERVTATLHLRYANGWDERVARGRYRLTDPKGRVVKDRVARPDDLVRMRAQVGN